MHRACFACFFSNSHKTSTGAGFSGFSLGYSQPCPRYLWTDSRFDLLIVFKTGLFSPCAETCGLGKVDSAKDSHSPRLRAHTTVWAASWVLAIKRSCTSGLGGGEVLKAECPPVPEKLSQLAGVQMKWHRRSWWQKAVGICLAPVQRGNLSKPYEF